MALIRWTTPTIAFQFDEDMDLSELDEAYLVIKQWASAVITKDVTSATVDTTNNIVEWTLTQAEAGSLDRSKKCDIMMDWLLNDGTRGRSDVLSTSVEDSGKNEVIS